ncbi:hypothetical protein POTOM_037288 [Populus tomentosa]|uniref:Uncharacterized protein n=1 Tax=Populus tomentosa TaxID=118781 RepID=A0A8X7YQ79_POPTO|nr:hypothetical protein POTOM_037288 [Populus tomentosa]
MEALSSTVVALVSRQLAVVVAEKPGGATVFLLLTRCRDAIVSPLFVLCSTVHSTSFVFRSSCQPCSFLSAVASWRKTKIPSSHGGYSVKMSWDVPPPSVKLIIHGKNLKVVPFDVRLCSRGGELGKGPRIRRCECRQLFNKLRKIEDEESDHGRHMKGFNKLKVREPMSQVVENDADTVSQRKDDDNLDEVGPFNIFVRGSSFMLS